MADFTLTTARALCNAAELALFRASRRPTIGRLTEAQLRQKVTRARELRDKWRDLYTSQRRGDQRRRGGRDGAENERSRRKSDLFADVLQRLNDQLAKVTQESAPSSSAVAKAGGKPRRVRAQSHRATRAKTRQQLKSQTAAVTDGPRKAAPPAQAPSAAKAAPSPANKSVKKAAKSAAKSASKSAATHKQAVPARKKVNRKLKGQKGANAAAKRQRVAVSGLENRTRGHVSARGRRKQARRDARR
jgi:hypothetical protein